MGGEVVLPGGRKGKVVGYDENGHTSFVYRLVFDGDEVIFYFYFLFWFIFEYFFVCLLIDI